MSEPASSPSIQSDTTTDDFLPIPLAAVQQDTATSFDLYIRAQPGAPPTLYRSASIPFSEEAMERLLKRNIGMLWIRATDRAHYRRYVEEHLGTILADTSITMEKRSELLYDSAQEMVKDVLADPRASGMVRRSSLLVQHMVKFLYTQSRAFQHLIQVTSYDYYTYTHSVDVFVYSITLAERLNHGEDQVQDLGQGALLHDIGKSLIDPDILNCKGALSDEQWAVMRTHPLLGEQLLREQGVHNRVMLDVVRHHHEKTTGKGYPDGLPAQAISSWVRIAAIADIFSALTTRRPYKEAMSTFAALQLMKDKMAEELDKQYFRVFVQLMASGGGAVRKHAAAHRA